MTKNRQLTIFGFGLIFILLIVLTEGGKFRSSRASDSAFAPFEVRGMTTGFYDSISRTPLVFVSRNFKIE